MSTINLNLAEIKHFTVLTYQPPICKSWEPLSEIAVKDGWWYFCGTKTRKICSGEKFEENNINPLQIQENWKNLEILNSYIGKPYYGYLTFNWGETPTEKAIVDVDDAGKISRIRTYSGMNWNIRGYGSPVRDTKD
jgi:hypothetical protein